MKNSQRMYYRVEDYETGTAFAEFVSREDAVIYCAFHEKFDKAVEAYTPGFYAIRDLHTDEVERYNY